MVVGHKRTKIRPYNTLPPMSISPVKILRSEQTSRCIWFLASQESDVPNHVPPLLLSEVHPSALSGARRSCLQMPCPLTSLDQLSLSRKEHEEDAAGLFSEGESPNAQI
ncbi:hypothetical protein V6N11_032701 [Hibiscus sabdariffa]|uniref:Uncharacterized protein n=1 Tax=Hibiscus sabdariffa TaxID=183260 RepID=A0ABR2T1E7_9ROSI